MNAPHFIKDFYLFILLTGITRFDLLGDFGRFNWLGNFYIVLSYNLLFAIVTTLCLVRKFTSAVREELFKALGNLEIYGHFFLLIMTLTFEFLFSFLVFMAVICILDSCVGCDWIGIMYCTVGPDL